MEQVFKEHQLCKLHGPLGPYFDSYATEMCSEGYAQQTREVQIRVVAISTDGWQGIGLPRRKSLQSCLGRSFARERDVDI
jgi:hypothetical protein